MACQSSEVEEIWIGSREQDCSHGVKSEPAVLLEHAALCFQTCGLCVRSWEANDFETDGSPEARKSGHLVLQHGSPCLVVPDMPGWTHVVSGPVDDQLSVCQADRLQADQGAGLRGPGSAGDSKLPWPAENVTAHFVAKYDMDQDLLVVCQGIMHLICEDVVLHHHCKSTVALVQACCQTLPDMWL